MSNVRSWYNRTGGCYLDYVLYRGSFTADRRSHYPGVAGSPRGNLRQTLDNNPSPLHLHGEYLEYSTYGETCQEQVFANHMHLEKIIIGDYMSFKYLYTVGLLIPHNLANSDILVDPISLVTYRKGKKQRFVGVD